MLKFPRVFFKQPLSLIIFCIILIFSYIFLILPITKALAGMHDASGKYANNNNQTRLSNVSLSQKSVHNLDNNVCSDRVPPVIADFDNGVVVLQWTAPGDDGYDGQAAGYDLRYQISQLGQIDTEQEWQAANQVEGEPLPSPAGQIDSMMVIGLAPGLSYYFCIKAYDEAGNYSGLSNSPLKTAYDPGYVINTETIGCGTVHLDPAGQFYQFEDTVVILAEPCEYWEFYGWSGDYNGNDNPVIVIVTADINITAAFITDFIRGDANGNGTLQLSDALYLVSYFAGLVPRPYPEGRGDANADGLINLGDILYLISYFRGNGPPPPPPSPPGGPGNEQEGEIVFNSNKFLLIRDQ